MSFFCVVGYLRKTRLNRLTLQVKRCHGKYTASTGKCSSNEISPYFVARTTSKQKIIHQNNCKTAKTIGFP